MNNPTGTFLCLSLCFSMAGGGGVSSGDCLVGRKSPVPQTQEYAYLESTEVQVNVSARHGSLSSHDQEVIREKVEKLRRFFDRVNAIEVTVDFQHQDEPEVEINASAEHAPDFVAKATASTVLSALDAATQKVEQQLRKHKEKLTGHKSTGVKHIPPVDDESE